jgi:hypothetical protein
MKVSLKNWPKLVFFFVPAIIAAIAATVMAIEYLQPDTEKAIRAVKESPSRKEGFSVQQYLYATLYHEKDQGAAIEIAGWRAEPSTDRDAPIIVVFSYRDQRGWHVARWGVNLELKKLTPLDEISGDLSWH